MTPIRPVTPTAVFGPELPGRPVQRHHVHAVLLEVVIEPIAVIRAIANEMFRLGLQQVEVVSCTNVTS
jgi:hypothetical protein